MGGASAAGMNLTLLYLSDILDIHDVRFLEKYARTPHRVILYTFHHPSRDLPREIARIPRLDIVRRVLPAYPRRVPRFLAYSSDFVRASSSLKRDIRRWRVDLVISGWLLTSSFLAASTGFHPIAMMPWGSDVLLLPRQRRRYRWMTRYALRRADFILCDAGHVRDEIVGLARLPRDRILVLPWGVDLSLFNPGRSDPDLRARLGWEGRTVLITTRALDRIYQIEAVLHALKRLAGDHPDLRLLIVGDGPCAGDLKNLARELGVESRVHFAGFVPNDRVARYLNAADVYVSPSLSDGSSLCLLEALACGLPVVVSDLPAIREWVTHGENGLLFDPRSREELASRLDTILSDPGLRASFRARNLAVARERADWDRNFERLLRAQEELVRRFSAVDDGAGRR